MKLYNYSFYWFNCVIFYVIQSGLITQMEVEANEEFGSIDCVDGKWKVDTKLMALIMTCPLPLDGSLDSIMKMVKCALNKLGMFDGETLTDDCFQTWCSIFAQPNLQAGCLKQATLCADNTLLRLNWELIWPAWATCFVPWAMGICNI